jgi:hypothetical protein
MVRQCMGGLKTAGICTRTVPVSDFQVILQLYVRRFAMYTGTRIAATIHTIRYLYIRIRFRIDGAQSPFIYYGRSTDYVGGIPGIFLSLICQVSAQCSASLRRALDSVILLSLLPFCSPSHFPCPCSCNLSHNQEFT